jgi:hypothetical protein
MTLAWYNYLMTFFDFLQLVAAGFFRQNARSEGAAEGGGCGEFRRVRASRRSEAEAVSEGSLQNGF